MNRMWMLALAAALLSASFAGCPMPTAEPGTQDDDPLDPVTVWYVDKDNTSGTEDGTSWATAFTTIQRAIDVAHAQYRPGQVAEVWVAEGVYDEQRNSVVNVAPPEFDPVEVDTGSVMLRPSVALYGGFSGTESVRDARDWTAHETMIDGTLARAGSAALHVILPADHTSLDGFTVRGGRAGASVQSALPEHFVTSAYGGAMRAVEVTGVAIRNCHFTDNRSLVQSGGALVLTSASQDAPCELTDCRFTQNEAAADGGAVTLQDVLVRGCSFVANRAGRNGGAMFIAGLTTLRDCELRENYCDGAGGAIVSAARGVTLQRCLLQDNRAEAGGAFFGDGTLEDCVFVANEAEFAGAAYGGHPLGERRLRMRRCWFEGNRAINGRGGAVTFGIELGLLENCVFWNNSATGAGGAVSASGHYVIDAGQYSVWAIVLNCTFVGNTGAGAGDALYLHGADLLMRNTVLWDHADAPVVVEKPEDRFAGTPDVRVSHSLIEGGYEGEGNLAADPLFADALAGDFHLQAASPAIDAGSADGPFSGQYPTPANDIEGAPRPQGQDYDIGAYEFPEGR